MKVYKDIYDLDAFNAWGGAADTKSNICYADKGEEFIDALDDLFPDGIDELKLNDILAFEEEWCYELVGLNSYGVEPADAGEVANYICEAIEAAVEQYNYEHDTELTSGGLGIMCYDFKDSIEEWLVENQEDETDEELLADRWLDDYGRDEIEEMVSDLAPNIPEADDHNHGDDC